MLANGCRELPQDHGYPVRVVTPGITGARAVKWVKRISPARQVGCSDSCVDLCTQARFHRGSGVHVPGLRACTGSREPEY